MRASDQGCTPRFIILFLLYINDLPDRLNSQVLFFTDDTIVYMAVSNTSDAEAVQKDLNLLEEWEEQWQMAVHPLKCNILRVARCIKPCIYIYSLQQNIQVSHFIINIHGTTTLVVTAKKQTLQQDSLDVIYQFLKNTSKQMHKKHSYVPQSSMLQQCRIHIPRKTNTSWRWSKEGEPAMSATTTAESRV